MCMCVYIYMEGALGCLELQGSEEVPEDGLYDLSWAPLGSLN